MSLPFDTTFLVPLLDVLHSVFVEGDAEPQISVMTMAICSLTLLAFIGFVQTQRPQVAVRAKAIGRLGRC